MLSLTGTALARNRETAAATSPTSKARPHVRSPRLPGVATKRSDSSNVTAEPEADVHGAARGTAAASAPDANASVQRVSAAARSSGNDDVIDASDDRMGLGGRRGGRNRGAILVGNYEDVHAASIGPRQGKRAPPSDGTVGCVRHAVGDRAGIETGVAQEPVARGEVVAAECEREQSFRTPPEVRTRAPPPRDPRASPLSAKSSR